MEQLPPSADKTKDIPTAGAHALPWVKPTVERIPLTEATNNGLEIGPPFDGVFNSAS